MSAQESVHADEHQCYEWVLMARAYGSWSLEYVKALVRNAHEKAVHRIEPATARNQVIRIIMERGYAEEYNARAPPRFKI